MHMMKYILLIPLLLAGCDTLDYDGIEPKRYNEVLFPKTNQVESASMYHPFHFADYQNTLDHTGIHQLREFVSNISPSSVDQVTLFLAHKHPARQRYIIRQLRGHGFARKDMHIAYDPSLSHNEVLLHVAYAYVISPDCPDWRKKSNLTYSNTLPSHMGCATATNLGQQMANPRDLQKSSTSYVAPGNVQTGHAIDQYINNEVPTADQSGAMRTGE